LCARFITWRDAWWVIQSRLGIDGRPPLEDIHNLAAIRAHGTSLSDIEERARVMLDGMNKKPEGK
jgi:hypothetical protein